MGHPYRVRVRYRNTVPTRKKFPSIESRRSFGFLEPLFFLPVYPLLTYFQGLGGVTLVSMLKGFCMANSCLWRVGDGDGMGAW